MLDKTIKPYEIGFDFDGTFADTMSLFLAIAKQEYNIDWIKYHDFTQYDTEKSLADKWVPKEIVTEIFHKIIFWYWKADVKLHTIPYSVMMLQYIAKETGKLTFITHRPPCEDKMISWIRTCLNMYDENIDYNIVYSSSPKDKYKACQENGIKYFLDNSYDVCYSLFIQGIKPITYIQPWNDFKGFSWPRIQRWDELIQMIDWN